MPRTRTFVELVFLKANVASTTSAPALGVTDTTVCSHSSACALQRITKKTTMQRGAANFILGRGQEPVERGCRQRQASGDGSCVALFHLGQLLFFLRIGQDWIAPN